MDTTLRIYNPSKLAARRRALGISQKAMSAATGLGRSHISAIETGVNTPSPQTIVKIAVVLKCDPTAIFEDLGLM